MASYRVVPPPHSLPPIASPPVCDKQQRRRRICLKQGLKQHLQAEITASRLVIWAAAPDGNKASNSLALILQASPFVSSDFVSHLLPSFCCVRFSFVPVHPPPPLPPFLIPEICEESATSDLSHPIYLGT